MTNQLKEKTVHGLFWSFLERLGQQALQFVFSIVLARLLLPEDFGLIAMLAILVALSELLINSGYGQALIQKETLNQKDSCSVFYFNIVAGVVVAGLLCLAAPVISQFYEQQQLVPIIYVMSIGLLANAFGQVPLAMLARAIDFKSQFNVSLLSTILSGTVGILMALNGFGVWSLVGQFVGNNIFRTVLLLIFAPWKPALTFRIESLREMFPYGSRLFAADLIEALFRNAYLVVIGKVFSPQSLGFYSRARELQQYPVAGMTSVVSRVVFPVFSKLQDDLLRLRQGARRALTMLMLFNIPLMVGLAVVAEPLIVVLLTEKWLPVLPYLRLFCIVGLLYPAQVVNRNILSSLGRSDLLLHIEVVKKLVVALAILLTYRFGIIALLWGQIVTSVFAYYLNSLYSGKLIGYSVSEQLRDLVPYFGISILMGGFVSLIGFIPFSSEALLLLLQILSGILIYLVFCSFFRLSSFSEIIDVLKERGSAVHWGQADGGSE